MVIERVNHEIAKELNIIVSRELKDPRLNGRIISITAVETAKDLKTAKAFVSIMDALAVKEVLGALNGATEFIRGLLFDRLKIRTVPHITFVNDNSLVNGYRIEAILKGLNIEPEENKENDD